MSDGTATAQIDFTQPPPSTEIDFSQPPTPDRSSAGYWDDLKDRYGLPHSVDLSKTYQENWGRMSSNDFNKMDVVNFSKAYSEANPQPERRGFLQNLWGEGQNLFKNLTEQPAMVAGTPLEGDKAAAIAENPANAIPVVGPMAVARAKQAKTDPSGALGAAVTDVAALTAPFLLDRMLPDVETPVASKIEEAGAMGLPSEIPKAAGTPAPTAASAGSAPNLRTTPFSSAPATTALETEGGKAGSFASRLGIVDGPPDQMLTQAIKPGKNNIRWNADVARAIPDLKAAEADLGHPIQNIDDGLEAASIAKKKIWSEFQDKMNQANAFTQNAPSMGSIDGNKVADAMLASIDKRTALQNPALVDRITKVADTYRRPMSLNEAEDFLESVNNDLHSYYAKNKVGQQVAAKDPAQGYVVAEGNALRKELYDTLDNLTGPGAADLKQRYGALSNVQNEMTGRKNVAARQQPQSLAEQLTAARAYGKIAAGIVRGSPGSVLEGTESLAAGKWLKERNTTDAILSRAFAKVGSPQQPAIRTTPFAPPGTATGLAATVGGAEPRQNEGTAIQ